MYTIKDYPCDNCSATVEVVFVKEAQLALCPACRKNWERLASAARQV